MAPALTTSSPRDFLAKMLNQKWLFVFFSTFIFVLIFELYFKASIIFSDAFFLDDFFYFERSINGFTFNTLNEGLDTTPNLILYRAVASTLSDISLVRVFNLVLFCLDAGLLAVILYRIVDDAAFSVFVAAFAFITPFSHIMTVFANGSYFVTFFLFYFSAFLFLREVNFTRSKRKDWAFLAVGLILAFSAPAVLDSGVLLLIPLLVFWVLHSNALQTRTGRLAAIMIVLAYMGYLYFTLTSLSHPYKDIPGRLVYSLDNMFLLGLSILSHMVWRYVEPMYYTGYATMRDNFYPALALIGSGFSAFVIVLYRRKRSLYSIIKDGGLLPYIIFFSLSIIISIGPYTVQTVTHIWHYFPHTVFFVTFVMLLLRVFFHRYISYAALSIVASLTIFSYARTIPRYDLAVERQAQFVEFVLQNSDNFSEADSVFVLSNVKEPASGLVNPFQITSLIRYHTKDPFFSRVTVLQDTKKSAQIIQELPHDAKVFIIKLTDEFGYTTIEY